MRTVQAAPEVLCAGAAEGIKSPGTNEVQRL
jgi:hypothetical protein